MLSYQVYKPGKWYNQWQSWANVNYSRRYNPAAYQNFGVDGGYYVQFKNFWSFEADLTWKKDAQDFYEARNEGRIFRTGGSYGIDIYINPNRTKAYNLGGNLSYRKLELFGGKGVAPQGTDRDYNVFNLDLIYQWQFAPGSELSIAYKNSAENSETVYRKKYLRNIDHILSGPQNNSLSVKMLYYIDYFDLRKKK